MQERIPFENQKHDQGTAGIAVQIHWFGLLLGYLYVNLASTSSHQTVLNLILAVGLIYNSMDTWLTYRRQMLLSRFTLLISTFEAIFIGLLCYFDSGPDSPFRYYYFLSLICCAIRYSSLITYLTCLIDCVSFSILYFGFIPIQEADFSLYLMLVILGWISWAASALSYHLRSVGDDLSRLNDALRENQLQLESRIEERTRELQESQAQLMHQDKMAGFGLLAAGIAHEVGNPLTSISTVIQIMEKRDYDQYTRDKLSLVGGQLTRIQGILRELITFSRPASHERTRFTLSEIVEEALNIAKYYSGTKGRTIRNLVPKELPSIVGIRDQLVQVVFNFVLNAIDATTKGGWIELRGFQESNRIVLEVEDNGSGISAEDQQKIFQPYFTTKKQGTGLGLFVIQRLIQAHGGTVGFQSNLGQGTIFRIEIPIANQPEFHELQLTESHANRRAIHVESEQ